MLLQGGAPLVINWFINPTSYRYTPTKTIVTMEIFAPTERYRTGAPPCILLLGNSW